MLKPCQQIYGGTEIIEEKPPFLTVENVTFLPSVFAGEKAGLFYPLGRVVSESIAYRGIPSPYSPLNALYTEVNRK
ncbi:hypothetical protein FAI41_02430 [Acetobacteraceae bacterium]|nr:hypothetical protein FAI41_02430 [Acetobacteraceae bacterium]